MLAALVSTSSWGRDRPPPTPDRNGRDADGVLLAMRLFLASLAMFFAAAVVAYWVLRLNSPRWPEPGSVRLPRGLWLSTGLLLAGSAALVWARAGLRHGRQRRLRIGLLAAMGLGLAFLVSQAWNWMTLWRAGVGVTAGTTHLVAWMFYVFSALHVLHVLGGLVALGVVTSRSFRGAYSAQRHAGVACCAMYWHFLDGVWLVMFGTMFLAP